MLEPPFFHLAGRERILLEMRSALDVPENA